MDRKYVANYGNDKHNKTNAVDRLRRRLICGVWTYRYRGELIDIFITHRNKIV